MNITDNPLAFFILLFAVFVALAEIGFRIQFRSQVQHDDTKHTQIEDTRTQIAVLLSLLLGFTLSMALARFDHRKELVVDEANAIGTTYLRAQMLNEPARSQSMSLLRRYIDIRLSWIAANDQQSALKASISESKNIQEQLWQVAAPIAQQTPNPIISIYAQTLNDMIDLHEKRMAATDNRIPNTIWAMLVLLGSVTCFTVGLCQRRRLIVSMLVPPLMIAVVMALVADIDSPRSGSIRVSQGSLMRLQGDLNAAPATTSPPVDAK